MVEILSPITKKSNCSIISIIDKNKLIKKYKNQYNIDVSHIIQQKKIFLCKCNDTEYYFYYPNDIDGDGPFYESFQKFAWYYIPWKWEHEKSLEFINKENLILEIGCGGGGFLKKLSKDGYTIEGLELNNDAVGHLTSEGYNVYGEMIQDFSKKNKNKYDIIVSFQVLEHISDVKSFIESTIESLKMGGKLIIAVPNNDSFLKDEKFNILNMPPHHMGLWKEKSLRALGQQFQLEVSNIFREPLQPQHYAHYYNTRIKVLFGEFFGTIIAKLTRPIGKYVVSKMANQVTGEGIMAIYKKIQ